MIRNILIVILVLSVIGCEKSQNTSQTATSAVQESFAVLKGALREGDGKEAVSRVTPATLDLYERCRKLALDSSHTDFESLSQLEVLLTFQLRWLLAKETLESMDGAAVFSWGVKEGLVKKQTLESIEIDNVQVEGHKAIATLINRGQPVTDLVFDFELHDGAWKLDFERVLKSSDRAFSELRKKADKTKIELAVYLIARTYNKEVPPQILKGPLK